MGSLYKFGIEAIDNKIADRFKIGAFITVLGRFKYQTELGVKFLKESVLKNKDLKVLVLDGTSYGAFKDACDKTLLSNQKINFDHVFNLISLSKGEDLFFEINEKINSQKYDIIIFNSSPVIESKLQQLKINQLLKKYSKDHSCTVLSLKSAHNEDDMFKKDHLMQNLDPQQNNWINYLSKEDQESSDQIYSVSVDNQSNLIEGKITFSTLKPFEELSNKVYFHEMDLINN